MERMLIIAVSLVVSNVAIVYGDPPPTSPVASASEEIGNLIKLTWNEKRLRVDRDQWEEVAGRKTDEERQQDQLDAMLKRGFPKEFAERIVGRQRSVPGGSDFTTNIPVGLLFEELRLAAGASGGGGGGNDQYRHWRGRGDSVVIYMQLKGKTQDFRFAIVESVAPYQEIIVEDHHQTGLRFVYMSPTQQLIFCHNNDGAVHVAKTSDENSLAFRADSYEQMLEARPGFSSEFTNLLKQLGLDIPLSRYDARVVPMVAALLLQPNPLTRASSMKLIQQLSSNDFQMRENADAELRKQFPQFQAVIHENLEDENLDFETKKRLERIVQTLEIDSSGVKRFIEQQKLLDDTGYLQSLLEQMEPTVRDDVRRRIDVLMGTEEK